MKLDENFPCSHDANEKKKFCIQKSKNIRKCEIEKPVDNCSNHKNFFRLRLRLLLWHQKFSDSDYATLSAPIISHHLIKICKIRFLRTRWRSVPFKSQHATVKSKQSTEGEKRCRPRAYSNIFFLLFFSFLFLPRYLFRSRRRDLQFPSGRRMRRTEC